MKTKIKNFIYNAVIKVIAKRLVYNQNSLTPDYLIKRGWITEFDEVRQKTYYVESGIKSRDMISVEFEAHYYRIWHGKERVFVALESSKEWFDIYYLMMHGDNGRHDISKYLKTINNI
jgi:hypothetical protein